MTAHGPRTRGLQNGVSSFGGTGASQNNKNRNRTSCLISDFQDRGFRFGREDQLKLKTLGSGLMWGFGFRNIDLRVGHKVEFQALHA